MKPEAEVVRWPTPVMAVTATALQIARWSDVRRGSGQLRTVVVAGSPSPSPVAY